MTGLKQIDICQRTLYSEKNTLQSKMHRWARLLKKQTSTTVYHLPKANKSCHFILHLQQTKGSCCFPLVLFSVYIYILKRQHRYIYIYIYLNISLYIFIDMYMYIYICWRPNRKQKSRQFSLIHLPFAYHTNGSLWFVRFFMKKQTEVIGLNGLNRFVIYICQYTYWMYACIFVYVCSFKYHLLNNVNKYF